MTAAIIISSLAILGVVATAIKKFDEEGPDMFKKRQEDNKEE